MTHSARACLPGLALAALLAACSGSTGPQGPAGATGATGPAGPQGPGAGIAALEVTAPSTKAITATITGVTFDAPQTPQVAFTLADQDGTPLKGLTSGQAEFTIAQLIDGAVATTGYTSSGAKEWVSFIITPGNPPSPCPVAQCATTATTLGTTETSGTLVDNGNGSYTYTFATDVTSVVTGVSNNGTPIAWNASATTRVAFDITGLAPANNAIYDFVPAGGNVTDTRDIIDTPTCNNCHAALTFHSNRNDLRYCVMCHNPQSADPASGNSIDLAVMVHKIHSGVNMPTLNPVTTPPTQPPGSAPLLNIGYWLAPAAAFGNGSAVNNFNTVLFPQDPRYCQTCHVQSTVSTATADLSDSYKLFPSIEKCGACHDNLNFATGGTAAAGNFHAGGVANNSQCTLCHGATAQINNGAWQVQAAHVPQGDTAAAMFQWAINSVTFLTPVASGPVYPVVNFQINNPSNSTTWNILAAAPFISNDPGIAAATPACTGAARLAIDLAWDTSDYTNWGSAPLLTPFTFTAALAAGATSGTLSAAWTSATGSYLVTFSDGESDSVTLTNGATTATWTTALANGVTASANANVATASNWGQPISLNPIIPGAGSVPATCSASTLVYGGASVPAGLAGYTPPAAPKVGTLYGPDANGTFTVVGPALPATPAGNCAGGTPCAPIQNVAAVIEGHPSAVLMNYASPSVPVTLAGLPIPPAGTAIASGTATGAQQVRLPVQSQVGYGNTANAYGAAATVTPVARREIADTAKCDVCHHALTFHSGGILGTPHGNNRTDNVQVCVVCHNPASTDVSQRQGLSAPSTDDGLWERPIDFKQMIHSIHGASDLFNYFGDLYTIYGFGSSPVTFTDIILPAGQNLGNCANCHVNQTGGFFTSPWTAQTFYPGDPAMQPTTYETGLSKQVPNPTTVGNPIARTPSAAACTGCHVESDALSHMEQNGASVSVTKDPEGRWVGTGAQAETCVVCHGPGGIVDIAVIHSVSAPTSP
ncbi:MAG TPA: OmcA/MtrC family decaheme c-type cytochrome [Steroidobacteraceae bacterium]|nr:OmcA/MtrC family decaheme c-type cytochrome [Steroidobacteraceae bacterium]